MGPCVFCVATTDSAQYMSYRHSLAVTLYRDEALFTGADSKSGSTLHCRYICTLIEQDRLAAASASVSLISLIHICTLVKQADILAPKR